MKKLSSKVTNSFAELAAFISIGTDWIVTSNDPSGPVSGRPLSDDYDIGLVFDGGSRGNPGQGYGSFTYKGRVVRWPTGVSFPGRTTNNQAEYQSLISGLRAVIHDCRVVDLPATDQRIYIWSDSQLLVNQVNGDWKIKNAQLRELHVQVTELLNEFAEWTLVWHPRSESVRILGH